MAGELPTGVTVTPTGPVTIAQGQVFVAKAVVAVTGTNDGDPDPWTNDIQFYYAHGADAAAWVALGDPVEGAELGYGELTPGETGPYFLKAVVTHTDPNEDPDVVTTFESNVVRLYAIAVTERVQEHSASHPLTGIKEMEVDLSR